MSLLGRLAHDALASHEGVVNSARARLDTELRPVATGPYTWRLVPVAQLMGSSEAMSQSLRTLLGTGRIRVDRVLYAEVPTAKGALEVAVPFSGKDTLSPQFSLRLSARAPSGALLERSAMGSWGFGNWVPSQGFEDTAAAQALCAALKEADLSDGVQWDCELPGDYIWKLGWTLQLVPSGPGQSRLLMQSGRLGILFTRFGVDVFLKKVDQSLTVLQGLAAHPEAPPGVVEQCWADRVTPLLALQPNLGVGVTAAPATALSAPGAGSPTLDMVAKLKSRGTLAVVLSAVAVPVCCVPLGLVGGGLALHTRAEAARQGVPAPGTTVAALVLSAVSLLFFGLGVVAAVFGPKTEAAPVSQAAAVDDVAAEDDAALQVQVGASDQARTGFRITRVYTRHQPTQTAPFHAAGGEWTYLDAALENEETCRFTMGVSPSKNAGGFGFGKAALSVENGESADCLVNLLASDFGVDAPPPRTGPVTGPLEINTAVLGQAVARGKKGGFSGKGNWVATKLFFERDESDAEVFFNFDLASRRGEFSEKDADYNQPLVNILAASLREEAKAPTRKQR